MKIIKASDIRRMSEYGANYPIYREIQGKVIESETDVLKEQLKKSIDLLELTGWQKQKMHEISINTIGDLISAPEGKLKQAKYHWQLYHEIEGHSVFRSLHELGCWAFVKGTGIGIDKRKV